jgi:hypothetical protein
LAAGAVQDTVDWVLTPFVPDTTVGAPGVPAVIEFDDADAGPFPLPFLAVTVKV